MKATELRIGNLFQEKYSGKVIEVIELTQKNVTFSGSFPKLWQAVKIPLTEEWLLKFGFDKNMLTSLHLSFIWYGPDNLAIKGMLGSIKPYNIKYVHQLQNLYFALTGKELEANP